ncbi:hypothetical protein FOMA001_g18669 [Fusarium oxysporum f. sp. matthiolae]|nr:hypothetical protein FOMA001_g18669 [Fusarium oxysporum f. sp. matthiolae]
MASVSKRKTDTNLQRDRDTKVACRENYPISPKSDGPDVLLDSIPENTANSCDTSSWAPLSPDSQDVSYLQVIASQPQPSRSWERRLRPLLPAVDAAPPEPAAQPKENKGPVVSPFTIREELLCARVTPLYGRPEDGQVNGYVKFHWPSRNSSQQRSVTVPLPSGDDVEDATTTITPSHALDHNPSASTPLVTWHTDEIYPDGTVSLRNIEGVGVRTVTKRSLPVSSQDASLALTMGKPRMLPSEFGLEAQMDPIGRRLFEFYLKNWCPGRSVLSNTNLWLKDLAPMHKNEGILHAIQSLAGIYIYDYVPDERIRQRTNRLYVEADQYFSMLLNAPESRENGKVQEVITIAVLLSMQDVLLMERHRKKPHKPRWLEGFEQAAHFLRATDPSQRYWDDPNTQCDSLRTSHSIIVGRGVILAQPMMALPAPETMNPEEESGRFRWLTYGSEKDMYEIHGGCGFSKKLLHVMSQVTYCAARLQQEPESVVVPYTAKTILRILEGMRQWSREDKDWETVRNGDPTIYWVRDTEDGRKIDSSQIMTEVTAEAWRIAAIIYYQCRLLRLPRDHTDVLAKLEDLAKCIQIMPTSGPHFTAQAPLLPVFFLGLLATKPKHMAIARDWFEDVVSTPVRSTVPPLYEALKRIWEWIDKKVPIQSDPTDLAKDISERVPWWENVVANVLDQEEEILCLT